VRRALSRRNDFSVGSGDGGELKTLPQRDYLRRAAGELQLASVATTPTLAHGLTYGGELLPLHPIEAARTGATARVPLVIGSNRREASLLARDKTAMLPTHAGQRRPIFRAIRAGGEGADAAAYPGYPLRRAFGGHRR